jgi:hypothetical protein
MAYRGLPRRLSLRSLTPRLMMDALSETAIRLLDIEARQDDVLRQLEELERRIEQVLAEHLPALASLSALVSTVPAASKAA